jgi:hypothetical protein
VNRLKSLAAYLSRGEDMHAPYPGIYAPPQPVTRREYVAVNFNPVTRKHGDPMTDDQMALLFAEKRGLDPAKVHVSPGRNEGEYLVEYSLKFP